MILTFRRVKLLSYESNFPDLKKIAEKFSKERIGIYRSSVKFGRILIKQVEI